MKSLKGLRKSLEPTSAILAVQTVDELENLVREVVTLSESCSSPDNIIAFQLALGIKGILQKPVVKKTKKKKVELNTEDLEGYNIGDIHGDSEAILEDEYERASV